MVAKKVNKKKPVTLVRLNDMGNVIRELVNEVQDKKKEIDKLVGRVENIRTSITKGEMNIENLKLVETTLRKSTVGNTRLVHSKINEMMIKIKDQSQATKSAIESVGVVEASIMRLNSSLDLDNSAVEILTSEIGADSKNIFKISELSKDIVTKVEAVKRLGKKSVEVLFDKIFG